jgi:hypothetical protein
VVDAGGSVVLLLVTTIGTVITYELNVILTDLYLIFIQDNNYRNDDAYCQHAQENFCP